jgi:8-oxo-dGTP pyrophosphatase MutT (NUDIX family)
MRPQIFQGPSFSFSDESLTMKRAACVLLWKPTGEVLAVTRRQDPSQLCLPGGKCETQEEFRACAVRETFEETGIEVPEDDLLWQLRDFCESFPDGPNDHDVVAFSAPWQESWGQVVQCEPGIEPRWVTFDQLIQASAMPRYNKRLREVFNEQQAAERVTIQKQLKDG